MASSADISGLRERVREYARARAEKLGEVFVETARGFAPRRTGALADSIEVESVDESSYGFTVRVVVGEEYGVYQNFGTGVYGPRGSMIRVGPPGIMVFDGIGGLVFTHKSRGTEPTHFWERTVDSWSRIVSEAS